jgi:hypothetical protein
MAKELKKWRVTRLTSSPAYDYGKRTQHEMALGCCRTVDRFSGYTQ